MLLHNGSEESTQDGALSGKGRSQKRGNEAEKGRLVGTRLGYARGRAQPQPEQNRCWAVKFTTVDPWTIVEALLQAISP